MATPEIGSAAKEKNKKQAFASRDAEVFFRRMR